MHALINITVRLCVVPLKSTKISQRMCPGIVSVGVCVCVCFNLDPQVRIQSIFFFYLVTNEASFSVQRKESTFKYHCNSGACLSASLLSH